MRAVYDPVTHRLRDLLLPFFLSPLCAVAIFTPFVLVIGPIEYGEIEIGWKHFVLLSYGATLAGGTGVLFLDEGRTPDPPLAVGGFAGAWVGCCVGLVFGIFCFPFTPIPVTIGSASGMAAGICFVALLPAKRTPQQRRLAREREGRRCAGGDS